MTDHLPRWATWRCDDCGEMFLPGFGSVSSNGRLSHGGLKFCKRQATWVEANPDGLAIIATLMGQAIVEAREMLGRFMSECEDEEWEPVANTILGAITSLDRGYHAREFIEAPSTDPNDYHAAFLWSLLRPLLPVEAASAREVGHVR